MTRQGKNLNARKLRSSLLECNAKKNANEIPLFNGYALILKQGESVVGIDEINNKHYTEVQKIGISRFHCSGIFRIGIMICLLGCHIILPIMIYQLIFNNKPVVLELPLNAAMTSVAYLKKKIPVNAFSQGRIIRSFILLLNLKRIRFPMN